MFHRVLRTGLMSESELVPLLGEIRDQLKRIADSLKAFEEGNPPLPVEIGEPTIRIRLDL